MFKFRISTVLLFVVSSFLIGISSKYTHATELIYTVVINRFIREKLSLIVGKTKIPIGDILAIILILLVIYAVINFFRRLISRKSFFTYIARVFWGIVNISSLALFIYILVFGLNYHTPQLGNSLIEKYNSKYSTNVKVVVDNEKKNEVYKYLVDKSIETKKLIEPSSFAQVNVDNLDAVSSQVEEGYRIISDAFINLKGEYSKPKLTFLTPVYSFLGLDASYYMLTNEIVIDKQIPNEYLPFLIAKYMAYQRGVAREDEANFYAYLACINNTDPIYQYSGYISMLSIIMDERRVMDKISYNEFLVSINENIKNDVDRIDQHVRYQSKQKAFFARIKYHFRRINGDVRVDDVNTQTSYLTALYYSLFTY